MQAPQHRTTIRFGAAQCGLHTSDGSNPITITLERASQVDKANIAHLLCELHGIKGKVAGKTKRKYTPRAKKVAR